MLHPTEIPARVTTQTCHAEEARRRGPVLFPEREGRNGLGDAGESAGPCQAGGPPQCHRIVKCTLAARAHTIPCIRRSLNSLADHSHSSSGVTCCFWLLLHASLPAFLTVLVDRLSLSHHVSLLVKRSCEQTA